MRPNITFPYAMLIRLDISPILFVSANTFNIIVIIIVICIWNGAQSQFSISWKCVITYYLYDHAYSYSYMRWKLMTFGNAIKWWVKNRAVDVVCDTWYVYMNRRHHKHSTRIVRCVIINIQTFLLWLIFGITDVLSCFFKLLFN